jgi:hypothetical protein
VDGDGLPDPARRLSRFREEHPDIKISSGSPWEAEMPEPDGAQRWIVRYDLHDLLDEVEYRLAEQAASRSGCVDRA